MVTIRYETTDSSWSTIQFSSGKRQQLLFTGNIFYTCTSIIFSITGWTRCVFQPFHPLRRIPSIALPFPFRCETQKSEVGFTRETAGGLEMITPEKANDEGRGRAGVVLQAWQYHG